MVSAEAAEEDSEHSLEEDLWSWDIAERRASWLNLYNLERRALVKNESERATRLKEPVDIRYSIAGTDNILTFVGNNTPNNGFVKACKIPQQTPHQAVGSMRQHVA
jgi:hypothetical protein